MSKEVYDFIKQEENSWKTTRVPLTNSKDWNMLEHIERCIAVSSGFYHTGKNDGTRPYNDIVTPIIDVAFRLEGFDVKEIVPYVDNIEEAYKSFIVKKFHPEWARKNELDSFIDEVVESSIIFDLVLIKDVNGVRPEVIALQDISFCDQTDILSGPLCFKHNFSIPELLDFDGKWDKNKIDECIVMAKASKEVRTANNQEAKTPGKYIEVYELHGSFPESWLKPDGDPTKYVEQMHLVNYYTAEDGSKNGITLYAGKSKALKDKFKALKIDKVRSRGRACGRSIVERLFDPQVWNNYSAIKIKKMLDAAVNLLQTDSEEFGNKKITDLKEMTILKHEPGKPISRIDANLQNFDKLQATMNSTESRAMTLGSASEAALGKAPVSGTPFALQDLIVQQGEGIHEYRRGKIATFFADILYPDLILPYLVKEMNDGKKFSEEFTLDELREICDQIATSTINDKIKSAILEGRTVTADEANTATKFFKENFMKGGKRRFMETVKGELKDIPIRVMVNVAGKQRNMAQNADKITRVIQFAIANSGAMSSIPGLGKAVNELLEESGMSAIDWNQVVNPPSTPVQPTQTSPGMGGRVMSPMSPDTMNKNLVA